MGTLLLPFLNVLLAVKSLDVAQKNPDSWLSLIKRKDQANRTLIS